jgi:hypothetical protein
MSKEQGKFKWYDIRPIYQFIFIIVILLMIAGIVVMGIGGSVSPSKEGAYGIVKTDLQNAVNDYQNKNDGALPTINGTITINGSAYKIINICLLPTQNEVSLQHIIGSLWGGNGSYDDNCDGGCAECTTYGSYIWTVDDEGNVYSTCVGERCNTSGIDGFQGFP